MIRQSVRTIGFALACCIVAVAPARGASEKVLYAFGPNYVEDGVAPRAGLTNINGTFYGTTESGGNYEEGVIFSVTKNGSEKVLHSFNGSDGGGPMARMIELGGILYGTAPDGGAYNQGVVFSVTTSGTEAVLYSFKGGNDGANPIGALVAVDGTLYGTTSAGGAAGHGTVYSVTPAGTETVLHSFAGGTDGSYPESALTEMNGTLYGTTLQGGGNGCSKKGCGTVFTVTTIGAEKVVHVFQGGSDGAAPIGDLVEVDGILYGTTDAGGKGCRHNGCGTVFSITKQGSHAVVYSFLGGSDGANPSYGSLANMAGTLYGTTLAGGDDICHTGEVGCGVVFSVTPTGAETVVYLFQGGSDGSLPFAGVIDVGGKLFGTTMVGGTGDCAGANAGCGTVFRVTP